MFFEVPAFGAGGMEGGWGTYMKKREKMKLAFVKPKRLFGKHDCKKALKGNVFGITLATGQQLLCHVSYRFTSRELVKLVRTRIGPYVRAAYPSQVNLRILFDGEPLLHANEAEAALDEFGILLSAGLASEFPRSQSPGERLAVAG